MVIIGLLYTQSDSPANWLMGGEKTTKRFVAETYHIDLRYLHKYLLFLLGLKWRIILLIERALLFNRQKALEVTTQNSRQKYN